MKQLGRLLGMLVLFLGCLGWMGHQSAYAGTLNFAQFPATAPILAVETSRRNRADAKLETEFGKKLDLNNSAIRDFRQYRGMFPTLAKKIIQAAPFESVEEVLEIPGLTGEQKEILRANLDNFTVTPVESVFHEGDQRLNTGVYD